MPPKKVQEPERRPLIGRVGTNLKVGIVGVPNVGKSTFFNVLTKSSAAAENFPFCTIDPNENALGYVVQFTSNNLTVKMTCKLKIKTDFYIQSKGEISNNRPDQCIILKESLLNRITGLEFENSESVIPPTPVEPYPLVNSYYPVTDNVDPLERVNYLLDTKSSTILGARDNSEDKLGKHPYTERSAQQLYLQSNPVCFIIISKPGLDDDELGRQLAEYWQCVLIEPWALIEEEVQSGSRAGQCIEYNLRCGRTIGIDVILRLIEKRVNSDTSKHRGFVICGLPLIPNQLYKEEPLSTESAVFMAKEIYKDLVSNILENVQSETHMGELIGEGSEEQGNVDEAILAAVASDHEESKFPPVDLGEEKDVCYPPEIGTDYESQFNFLFNLLKPPFFIIYMMCSPKDLLLIRENTFFNIYSNSKVDKVKENTNELLHVYSMEQSIFQEVPNDMYETYFYNANPDNTLVRHLVSVPGNFLASIEAQLDAFYYTAVNFIENKIMAHDRQYFLKVDARTSVRRMMHVIKARLHCLPLQKVLVPEKISFEEIHAGEDAVKEDVPPQSLEEYFKKYRHVDTPNKTFTWTLSDFLFKCPVALRNGIITDGNPNFTVHFMNKLFFLSDEEAYLKFYRNPRPFLVDPYPRATCKMFICGPKCSGKSSVARCLSYLFNASILTTGVLEKEFLQQKEREFRERIRMEALAEAIHMFNEKRKKEADQLEATRIENIKSWAATVKDLIQRLVLLNIERQKELKGETKFELSSFPMAMAKIEVTDLETECNLAIGNTKAELEALNIPMMDISEYSRLLTNRQKLLKNIPLPLKKKNIAVPATSSDTLVMEYVNRAVNSAVFEGSDLIEKNLVEVLLNAIKAAEERYVKEGYNSGGWIVDGLQCDLGIVRNICAGAVPDEVIVLYDAEDFEFLRERYKVRGANRFTNYRQFFMDIKKLDAAWRSPSNESTSSYRRVLAEDIISEMFDDPNLGGTYQTEENNLVRNDTYYAELTKFHKKWPPIEEYLVSLGVNLVKIEVTDKSFPELFTETIRRIEDRYRVPASLFTEEDRQEEIDKLTEQAIAEEAPAEEIEKMISDELIQQNRNYGQTSHYCPVTLHESFVLWEGKERYLAKFQNEIYRFSNEENLKKFLTTPRDYVTGEPPSTLPPPRICVIGPPGCGKTYLARSLANNYGLSYISYQSFVKAEFDIENDDTFEDLQQKRFLQPELVDYLSGQVGLPESFYSDKVSSLWFEPPRNEGGFVIDDFPKRPSDVKMMVKFILIPDIIIELTVDELLLIPRLVQTRLGDWDKNRSAYRLLKNKKYQEALLEWEVGRKQKFNTMLEERRETRYAEKRKQKEEEGKHDKNKAAVAVTDSQVSFDSIAEQQDIDEVNRLLDIDMPPVVKEPEQTSEEVRPKIEKRVTEYVKKEKDYLQKLQILFPIDSIPHSEVALNLDDYEKNLRSVYCLTEDIKYRNTACFEKCFDVSPEFSEKLLSCGYFFLSKFGKLCPVQYHENKNPFYTYPRLNHQVKTFPTVHRSYIYFIVGEENLKKFKKDPLLYISVKKVEFPMLPITLAVSGPPKCGKTILANRIAQEYGMKVISRGQAARFVKYFLPFTHLAKNMEGVLRKGWELTDEMVTRCVLAASVDPRGVTQARRVPVPDERFDFLCEYFKPLSKVPAFLNVTDIAGLVKGASEGQGLGNAFLSHISACDAIFHLCRAFEDDDVTHIEGEVNPVRDLDIICEELRLKDEEQLMKHLEKLERTVVRGTDKKLKPEYDAMLKIKQVLVDEKKHIRFADWDTKDVEILNKYLFLTTKPAIYLVNLSEKDFIKKKNKWLVKIKEWVDKNDPGSYIIPFSGAFEHQLLEEYEDPALRKKFLEDNNTASALEKIIVQGYKTLQLEYFFTSGPDEVKAWTIQKGTKAPQAAGRIHTDFEKGFIMAEVMKFQDFKEEGSEAACKAAGKYRQQGRNYVVEDGDIIFFKFNAGAGLQAAKKK